VYVRLRLTFPDFASSADPMRCSDAFFGQHVAKAFQRCFERVIFLAKQDARLRGTFCTTSASTEGAGSATYSPGSHQAARHVKV